MIRLCRLYPNEEDGGAIKCKNEAAIHCRRFVSEVDYGRNDYARRLAFTRSGVNGSRRSRTPVASKMAFASAADVGPCDASPVPRYGSPGRLINATSIGGTSENVRIG
jgi:hypothetical protein